jgi:hypothetical protein
MPQTSSNEEGRNHSDSLVERSDLRNPDPVHVGGRAILDCELHGTSGTSQPLEQGTLGHTDNNMPGVPTGLFSTPFLDLSRSTFSVVIDAKV